MVEQKKKIFTVEIDEAWVFSHRNDDKLPIEIIEAEFSKNDDLKIVASKLTSITVVYSEDTADFRGLQAFVMRTFKDNYPQDNASELLNFKWGDYETNDEKPSDDDDEDEEKESEVDALLEKLQGMIDSLESEDDDDEKPSDDDDDDDENEPGAFSKKLQRIIDSFESEDEDDEDEEKSDEDGKDDDKSDKDGGDPDKKEQYKDELKTRMLEKKIDALVGVKEFKDLSHEIISIADEINRTKTFEVLSNQCYLFSIGDGYGLSTYLDLLADIMQEKRLCKMPKGNSRVREVRLDQYKESDDQFDWAVRTLDSGSTDSVRILCVDISEWMDHTDNRFFKKFLRKVENHLNQFIVVFRVPFVEKDILARINASIADVLTVKSIAFPPFSQDEIRQCAEEQLKKYAFSMDESAWEYFFERISQEKSDGKFYGVNTIVKVVKELVYIMHVVNSKSQTKKYQVTADETIALCGGVTDANLSGQEALDKLVGVDGIKKRIEEIVTQIEMAVKDGGQRPCIHMRFVGNPGTGKTTVARIIGKLLKERGVLRVGAFFECAGRDFCGRYIGETAPKTIGICRDAYGSVLFIDEAYTLFRGENDTKDFGREAIDTLIAEMENHRSDFVVIMAGYTDDIDRLMKGNLGLASRMPYTIEFPNFSREQLGDIFVSMVESKFKHDDKIFDVAREFFMNLPDSVVKAKEFSNARYVRNLFERTWAKSAMRCQLNGESNIVLTSEDFMQASADKEFATVVPQRKRIGF